MKAIENGLKRFEKGTKIQGGHIALKYTRVSKKQRVAMSVIYDRLKNNLNNEIETGVKFSAKECRSLNLPCANDFAFYYLDRMISDNSRVAIYLY